MLSHLGIWAELQNQTHSPWTRLEKIKYPSLEIDLPPKVSPPSPRWSCSPAACPARYWSIYGCSKAAEWDIKDYTALCTNPLMDNDAVSQCIIYDLFLELLCLCLTFYYSSYRLYRIRKTCKLSSRSGTTPVYGLCPAVRLSPLEVNRTKLQYPTQPANRRGLVFLIMYSHFKLP